MFQGETRSERETGDTEKTENGRGKGKDREKEWKGREDLGKVDEVDESAERDREGRWNPGILHDRREYCYTP